MKRFTVQKCDEGGTLFRNDGTPVAHTWDVVDRLTGRVVQNTDTRASARTVASEWESEPRKER